MEYTQSKVIIVDLRQPAAESTLASPATDNRPTPPLTQARPLEAKQTQGPTSDGVSGETEDSARISSAFEDKGAEKLPISRLRRLMVRTEKHQSHLSFLQKCSDEGLVPNGFQLKWSCHFGESPRIGDVLQSASAELVRIGADLASEKVSALQSEADDLQRSLLSKMSEDDKPALQSMLEMDRMEARKKAATVKERKLQRMRSKKETSTAEATQEMDSSLGDNRRERTGTDATEIFNLSSRKLTQAETSVLTKGLNFVPTRKQPLAQVISELKEWERLMRLREYWATFDTDLDVSEDPDRRYKTSKWTPPKGRDPCLDLYIEEVTRDVIRSMRKTGTSNMTSEEEQALQHLMKDDGIVIRPADKGSGVVIMNKEDYLEKLAAELHDGSTYEAVKRDMTRHVSRQVKNITTSMHKRGYIGKHQMKYLNHDRPRPGQVQGNPKVHKEGNPLRLIVDGRNHPTERLAELAEQQLQEHVEGLESHVRDTGDFLQKLRRLPQPVTGRGGVEPLLFCMDVRKLYPSVPRREGLEACRAALDGRSSKAIPTDEILKIIDLVLESNNFNLDADRQFLQKEGTAIGSRLGCNYACTYLGEWERELLTSSENKPHTYLRYIDDIFGIWLDGEQSLKDFHARANAIHDQIQVDLRMSSGSIDFLDVTVRLKEGMLETDLFTKPTDSKSYLRFDSDHPLHTKRAIPFGLGTRLRRICSREEDFGRHKRDLKGRLMERGYPGRLLDKELGKLNTYEGGKDKTKEVGPAGAESEKNSRVPLVLTYSSYLPNIRQILKSKRHILQRTEKLKKIFNRDPLVAFRRGTNLRDDLVHRKTRRVMKGVILQGQENCRKECVLCKRMYSGDGRVMGSQKECSYDKTIGCRSRNVVYGLWCGKCRKVVYVGETGGGIYARVQNHLSSIRTATPAVDLPVRRHFVTPGHSVEDLQVVGLERVWKESVDYRRVREGRWMKLLGTDRDGGLNVRSG